MRYQFTLAPAPTARPGHGIVFAALIVAAVLAYVVAACGDRAPEQAAARQPNEAVATPETASTGGHPVVTGLVSFEEADSAFHAGRYEDAVNLFTAYTGRRPENPWGYYMLGLSQWRLGNRDGAEQSFTKALELDSTHVKSHLNLSRVLLESGKPADARTHIDRAIALDSTSSEGTRLLGRVLEAVDCPDGAIAAYKRAILLDDADVWAMNNLGTLYVKLGRVEEAVGPIARANQLEKNVATFHNNLGTALERTGHFTAAAEAYRRALAVDSSYGKAQVSLTRVETLQEDSTTGPIDLTTVVQGFLEEVERWRAEPQVELPQCSQ